MSNLRTNRGRCILLTPPGGAAIAVVRLAGAGVGEFLQAHFDKPVTSGRCVHGRLRDGLREIDDPVVVVSGDGRIVDVSLHGGPWVVRAVLELARREGFDVDETPTPVLPAEAVDGESERQREVLQCLPLATTELALRCLLAQEAAWERFTRSRPTPEVIGAMLDDRSLYLLLHPPRVAIVGVPNVGKSTLANQLFAQERSITADVPGTTRDWVGELANVDGLAVTLVDTPGLRRTTDPIEREAIDRSREQVAAADLVVLVLDPTHSREPDQAALERAFPEAVRVANKGDRPAMWDPGDAIRTVATAGQGVDALRSAVRERFVGVAPFESDRARWWTQRQRLALQRALETGSPLSA